MDRLSRVAVVVVVVFGWACEVAAQGPPPARVRFDPVRVDVVEQRREVVGELRASSRSQVAAQEGGRVTAVLFDVGSAVEAGDVLARLDAKLLELDVLIVEAQLASARATVEEREAELAKVERDVRRLNELTDLDGASRRELEDAEIDVTAASARLRQASADVLVLEARIDLLRERIADMVVRAPFAGRVISKSAEVGEWVDEGEVVAGLVSLETVDAYIDLPERFVGALGRDGQTLEVRVDATGYEVSTASYVIVAEGDQLARTFPVRVRLENPEGKLRPGMAVRAMVPTGVDGEVVTVHKDAVLRTDVGFNVFFDGNGTAAPMAVDVAFSVGERYALRPGGGLRPGMRVVVEGNERMFPGQPLIDIEAGPPAEDGEAGAGPPAGAGGSGDGESEGGA